MLPILGVLYPFSAWAKWQPPPDPWSPEIVFSGWLWTAEGSAQVGSVDASFGDMVGTFGPGASIRVESKSKLSALMAGISYVHVSEDGEIELEGGTAAGQMVIDQVILDAGGGYRLAPAFEVLGTARYYLIFADPRFDVAGAGYETQSWMDVFLGGRLTSVSGRWTLTIRGDIGAGGSNFAWFGNGVLAYRTGPKTTVRAEYRILSMDRGDVESTNHLGWDVLQNGLGVGFGIGF